jgi:uncharacterized protein YuzE
MARRVTQLDLSVSARDDGTVEAAYFRFKRGKSARSVEVISDVLVADYDQNGELIGIEVLAPVKISDLSKLVEESRRPSFRRFAKQSGPPSLVRS